MTVRTSAQLLSQANQIRNEKVLRANSATRVGDLLVNIIDTLYVPAVDPSATGAVNTAAIQAAIDAAHAVGGGKVQMPAGVFNLATAGSNVALSLRDKSNIWFCGAGVGATELYLVDAADSHMLNIDGTASNIIVTDMTMNGNRANQGAGFHCIRVAEVNGIWLDRLYLKEASHYAVGLQSQTKRYMFLTNLKCENTGGDGIDTKNTDDDNAYCFMDNVVVVNFGLSTTDQAGIDLRGPWQVNNVAVEWTAAAVNGSGIRLRSGELLDSNGYGAHHSNISNFSCVATSGTGTGVAIDARDVKLSNGHCAGMATGYYWTDSASGSRAENCTAEDVTAKGFDTDPLAVGVALTSCLADGSGAEGFYLEGPSAKLVSCRSLDSATVGVRTVSTATSFEAHGVECLGATGVGFQLDAADARIVGGRAYGCDQGLTVTGARPRIIGFVSESSSAGDGVVLGVGSDDALVSGCTIVNNADEGINVRSDRCRLISNVITGNASWGVQIDSGGDDTFLDSNQFTGNAGPLTDAATGTRVGLLNSGLGSPYMLNFPRFLAATGAPSQVAPIGSTYLRLDGTTTGVASGVFVSYVKEFGSGVATGWVGK